MINYYPVETIHGMKQVTTEVQVRTLAMNFWATNEHSLNYKYDGEIPVNIKSRLRRAAEAAFKLDEEMSSIREEVYEAQRAFHRIPRSEEHTSELQSRFDLVCRLLLERKQIRSL